MTHGRCQACVDGHAVDPSRLRAVFAELERGDIDAALEAGLMALACGDCLDRAGVARGDRERLLATAAKLRFAWDARERFRAREARLLERSRRREARRMPGADAATPATESTPPVLPAAAASALARALARAKGSP